MATCAASAGYASSCMYMASRVSQIKKNLLRKSADGLSILMFTFTVTANLCTSTSIFLRLRSWLQFQDQLPWICGSLGTVSLDIFIYYQIRTYGCRGDAAREPLLLRGDHV